MSDPFGEEWFSDASQQVLAGLGRSVVDVPGSIIEVGSWTGRSTCALANAIFPRIVEAVDTWDGSPGEISADLAGERDVFAQWTRNVGMFTKGNVRTHRMGWREYLSNTDGPVALGFIDAEHTYVEVRDNILAFLPRMAPGGVLCGDDAHHPPVMSAVLETLGEVRLSASLWIWRSR